MKMIYLFLILLPYLAYASDCSSLYKKIEKEFYTRYDINRLRAITVKVNQKLTPEESEHLRETSKIFKSLPHDTPENQNQRIQMQQDASYITQLATERAGFKLLNPPNSPFDALIEIHNARDGFTDYLVEVRDLLIMDNPIPHTTVWAQRMDKAHNPYLIVNFGIMADKNEDYVSFKPNLDSDRILASIPQFLKHQLPLDCQSN